MSYRRLMTCDRCQRLVDDDGEHNARTTSLQLSRTDPRGAGGNFRMRFTSWDLCEDCTEVAQALLREWAPPSHDDWYDPEPHEPEGAT